MKISLNWLREYVTWDLSTEDLAHQLTMAGLEVESIDDLGKQYEGFIVGEVLEARKHPNADKLTVCRVNVGKSEPLQIVCGAPNVAAGQKVPVGLVGATVPRDQHDAAGKPFVLSRVKIRGVESFGMICSEYELTLGADKAGIMVLPAEAVPGTPLAEYFGLDDVVFEIGVTPNRPDCLSHIGVAREVAALTGGKLQRPALSLKETGTPVEKAATIRIEDANACPRYTARVIKNVKIQPSPEWMQKRLKAVGLRPINNIVDVTNYVLMETGHPLHAFDYDLLEDHTIVVQCARDGEKFTTLDEKERALRSDSLMICDAKKRVAVGGVMGGLNSEIRQDTKNVLLEAAYFHPSSIRKTSKHLGLSTDASQRFERGADPEITRYTIDRAAELIFTTGGGEVLKGVIDVYPKPVAERIVPMHIMKVNDLLGTELTDAEISGALKKIEFEIVQEEGDTVSVKVPTFRPDVEREVDLIEEVARVHGYGNIADRMSATIDFTSIRPTLDMPEILREWLTGCGYHEILTNSMQDPKVAGLVTGEFVKVKNPLGVEMSAMRTSLIPGLLQTIRHNQFHGNENLRLFEIGHVFKHSTNPDLKIPSSSLKVRSAERLVPSEAEANRATVGERSRATVGERSRATVGERSRATVGTIIEETRVAMALVGNVHTEAWDEPGRNADIFDMKGEVEALFKKISLDKHRFIYYPTEKTLSESCMNVDIRNTYAGFIGVIREDVAKMFEVEGTVVVAELDIDPLRRQRDADRVYVPVPKFPPTRRDLAFVVDANVTAGDMMKKITTSGGATLRRVKLFDIFTGGRFGEGKKSIAFRLEFLSPDRTLTDDEVNASVATIVADAAREFGAELRSV